MTKISSDRFQDYVIKDGRFIGAFEQMYRDCADPWGQDTHRSFADSVALSIISGRADQRVLDLGCGKGAFTSRMRQFITGRIVALDISGTAVQAARSRFPEIEFLEADARKDLPFDDKSFDLVVCNELLWYVLPDLDRMFGEIRRVGFDKGRLLLKQHFYQPGEQKYGNEVMEKPEDLLARLPFTVKRTVEIDKATDWFFIVLAEF